MWWIGLYGMEWNEVKDGMISGGRNRFGWDRIYSVSSMSLLQCVRHG
jgi:hypothetical protein